MRNGVIGALFVVTAMTTSAMAAEGLNPPLAANVTKAAAYDPPPTQYIVANSTPVFANHFMYGAAAVGQVERGQRIEALAKVRGYEWILVGRNGQGIGYVPISLLSPADGYVP